MALRRFAPLSSMPPFLKYLLVGLLGFLVDYGGMEMLVHTGMAPQIARIFSMPLAVLCTFALHRVFTFSNAPHPYSTIRQFTAFVFWQGIGAFLNYAVFWTFLLFFGQAETGMAGRFVAVCGGVAAGLLFNYTVLRAFVFPQDARPQLAGIIKRHGHNILLWAAALLALAFFAVRRHLHILAAGDAGAGLPPNADSWMRLVKIREWMAAPTHYYSGISGANAPFGGIDIHWTHFMDALHLFVMGALPANMPVQTQLLIAGTWVPVLLAVAALVFLVTGTRAITPARQTTFAVFALAAANQAAYNYFYPGNSDHHSLLITLWCALLALCALPLNASRAVLAGLVLGLAFWAGPEMALPAYVLFGVIGAVALFKSPELRHYPLVWAVASVTAFACLLVEQPVTNLFKTTPIDTLSIAWGSLLALSCAGCLALDTVFKRTANIAVRLAATGVVTASLGGVLIWLYPDMLARPEGLRDLAFFAYHQTISEFAPLVKAHPLAIAAYGWQPALAFFTLALYWKGTGPQRPQKYALGIFGAVMAVLAFLPFLQIRWIYYLQPLAIIILAITLPPLAARARGGFADLGAFSRRLRPYVLCTVLALSAPLVLHYANAQAQTSTAGTCLRQMEHMIAIGQITEKLGQTPQIVFAPADVSPLILFFTPHHTIFGNYHRETTGFADYQALLNAVTEAEARTIIEKRKLDILLLCPPLYEEGTWLYKQTRANKPDTEESPIILSVKSFR